MQEQSRTTEVVNYFAPARLQGWRPSRRSLIVAGSVVIVALLASVFRNPYAAQKGVRGVPEFVSQPLSFATARLGRPTRSFDFTVGRVDDREMPRANLLNLTPPLAPDVPIREVSWDEGQTFVTAWYRIDGPRELAVDALQWDKRLTDWAATMARPPAAST